MMGSIRRKLIGSLLFGLMMFLTNFCGSGTADSVHAVDVSNATELDTAINNHESEITLTHDIGWSNWSTIVCNCTLNLANHSITGEGLSVGNNGRLTINGSGGSIERINTDDESSIVQNAGVSIGSVYCTNGSFTLEGGTITSVLSLGVNATCTLNSGTVSGTVQIQGGTLIQNGGQITGDIDLRGGTFIDNTSSGSSSSGSSDSSDKKSSHKKHTTASNDFYYDESGRYGGLIDGVFAPTTMIPASAYPKFNSFLVKKLQATEAGSTLSVNADPWTSINKAVADAFTEKGDIGLAIKYTQGGVPLQVTIPAGTNLSEQLDENGYIGFPKLAQLYGAALVTENATHTPPMTAERGDVTLNAGSEILDQSRGIADLSTSGGGINSFAHVGGGSMRQQTG